MNNNISALALDPDSMIRLEATASSQAKGFIFCLNKNFYNVENYLYILAEIILQEKPHANNCFIFKFEQQKTIGINGIKEISSLLAIKANTSHRIFIIDRAERMSLEASNSLLKLLEELPDRTYVLLTSALFTSIVPTIRSRLPVYFLYSDAQIENSSTISLLQAKDFSSILNTIYNSEMSADDYNQLISDICIFIINEHPEHAHYISSIVKGQRYNVSPKLIIETLLLTLI